MLVLKNAFKLTLNAIGKSLVVSKIFSMAILKLGLYHWIFSFEVKFVLIPLLDYCFVEKQGNKRDLIGFVGLSSFETVFTLLAKAVAI